MSRRTLSVILALFMVVGFATSAMADVTGSFNIHLELVPEGTQTEAVRFEIDFQTELVINVTLSGLTFGADIGFGVTGLEFAVLSLTTSLGALQVFDEFVFAPPFGCTSRMDYSKTLNRDCKGTDVVPIGVNTTLVDNANPGDPANSNSVGFVKKRVELTLNIAGITLENLAIFEDVDFPDIKEGGKVTGGIEAGHESDHFGPGTVGNDLGTVRGDIEGTGLFYFVDQIDGRVDNGTPTFGFGDVITISGQTVSGITVSATTAICASGTNYIKKKSWDYEVNKACADTQTGLGVGEGTGGEFPPAQKTGLAFEEETIELGNIVVGGVTFTVDTTWTPGASISTEITATFDVLGLATAVATFTSNNITDLTLDEIEVSITSGNLEVTLTDDDGDLDIDDTEATLTITLNPNQNPATFITVIETAAGTGITDASFSLDVTRGILTVGTTTTFSGSGTLAWDETTIEMSVDGGGGITVSFDTSYTPSGIGTSTFDLSVSF